MAKNNISKKAVPNTTGFGRRVLVYFRYPMRTRTTPPRAVCARLDLRGARLVGRHQVEVYP